MPETVQIDLVTTRVTGLAQIDSEGRVYDVRLFVKTSNAFGDDPQGAKTQLKKQDYIVEAMVYWIMDGTLLALLFIYIKHTEIYYHDLQTYLMRILLAGAILILQKTGKLDIGYMSQRIWKRF